MKKIVKKGKNRLSPAARARIVAAQKRRWAAFYAKKAKAAKAGAEKRAMRKLPPAARAKMVATLKRRWAIAKAPKAAPPAAHAAEKPAAEKAPEA